MMHGPHAPGVDAVLAQLPDHLREPVDLGLRRCTGGPDNYLIGLRLLLAVGPEKFAAAQRPR